MTLVTQCPNCGQRRNERDLFCVSCGSQQQVPAALTGAPVAAGVAAGVAAVPTPSATGPAVADASVRLPVAHLAGIVVGVSIAVAALAVAITLVLSGSPPDDNDPRPASGDLQVVDVQNIRAEVPIAWDVVTRARDTIVAEDQASRALWLRSANLPTTITLDAIQERFLDKARNQSPDAKICAGPDTAALPGGPTDGRYFVICSTFVPQGGGPAVRLADAYYIAVDSSSVTVSVMQLTAVPESLEAFAAQVRDLPPPVWKLYGG